MRTAGRKWHRIRARARTAYVAENLGRRQCARGAQAAFGDLVGGRASIARLPQPNRDAISQTFGDPYQLVIRKLMKLLTRPIVHLNDTC
jgi:hypothetical protein